MYEEGIQYKGVRKASLVFWFLQYLANLLFWDSPQEGKELHMLSSSEQLCDGIELRAVAHVLMDFMDI